MTNNETLITEKCSAIGPEKAPRPDEGRTTPRRRWWPWPLLIAPYVAGLTWHGLHPVASVFTGDLARPRGSYIDENSLDPNHFQRSLRYPLLTPQRDAAAAAPSLCAALRSTTAGGGIVDCARRGTLEVATIVPSGTAVAPVAEALVVVLPSPPAADGDWLGSQLHVSVTQLAARLAAPERAPWLAKTVFLVAPTSAASNVTLHDTVGRFLDMNFGKSGDTSATLKGPIIRNLLVLDITSTPFASAPEIQVLPQGRNGILPNMDLVFLCTHVYRRGLFSNLAMSPYRTVARAWFAQHIAPRLPAALNVFANKLLEFLCFEYSLLAGPALPHAPALDRGIDALTLRLVLPSGSAGGGRTGRDGATAAALLVTGLDYILRALSNLHERLHHSTSLYLLVAPEAYVKHEEYLVPNLLLLVPCIVRAATLVFLDLRRFQPAAAGRAMRYILGGILLVSAVGLPFLLDHNPGGSNDGAGAQAWFGDSVRPTDLAFALVAGSYLPVVWWSSHPPDGATASPADAIATVQFLGCLLGVYSHVAMAFGHVALAFPSALVWAPLLAWPRYDALSRPARQGLFLLSCVAALCLFRSGVLAYDSSYARYVFLPLHWAVSVMTMSY